MNLLEKLENDKLTDASIKALVFTINQFIDKSIKYNCNVMRYSAIRVLFESADIFHAIKRNFDVELPERFFESFVFFKSGQKSLWFLDQLNILPNMELVEELKQQREKHA